MRPPSFVSRAFGRLAVVSVVALLAAWLGGLAAERVRLGGDEAAARAAVQSAVAAQVAALESRLEGGIAALDPATSLVPRAEIGDAAAQRQLFEMTAAAAPPGPPLVSITVYGEARAPIACPGRPSDIPAVRIDGPDSTFLAPGPQGLRLVRVHPIEHPALGRRVGTFVLETVLTPGSDTASEYV